MPSDPAAHPRAAAIVAAARACVGARFRPQGRSVATGLDCVGVVLCAARGAGIAAVAPPYALGGDHEVTLGRMLAGAGCTPVAAPAGGDVLEIAPAPRRRHLAVLTSAGTVHAHAGLGRVVEGPVDPAWRVLAAWRLPEA